MALLIYVLPGTIRLSLLTCRQVWVLFFFAIYSLIKVPGKSELVNSLLSLSCQHSGEWGQGRGCDQCVMISWTWCSAQSCVFGAGQERKAEAQQGCADCCQMGAMFCIPQRTSLGCKNTQLAAWSVRICFWDTGPALIVEQVSGLAKKKNSNGCRVVWESTRGKSTCVCEFVTRMGRSFKAPVEIGLVSTNLSCQSSLRMCWGVLDSFFPWVFS